jgi:hypothetical protein
MPVCPPDLEEEVRSRVVRWAAERYGITLGAVPRKQIGGAARKDVGGDEFNDDTLDEHADDEVPAWNHFAELYHASGASTHPEGCSGG